MPNRFAETVLASIEASKRQPFARVLTALGIRHVGGTTAQLLVEHFPSLDELERAGEAEIAEVPGIGPVVAATVEQYLADPHNRETLAKLRAHGLRFVEEAPQRVEGPLSGKTFVLTGTLETLSRAEAGERIARPGRQGRKLGQQPHRLRRGRREPRLEARQGPESRRRDRRRAGVPRHAGRRRWGRGRRPRGGVPPPLARAGSAATTPVNLA